MCNGYFGHGFSGHGFSGHGFSNEMMGNGFFMPSLFWIIIAIILIAVVVYFVTSQSRKKSLSTGHQASAMEILDNEYAKGNLTSEQYNERKENLMK